MFYITSLRVSFDNFIASIRAGKKGVNYKNIDDFFDFGLSPRAYADSSFGIIALEAMQRLIRADRKFDKISDEKTKKKN